MPSIQICRVLKTIMKKTNPNPFKEMKECNCPVDCNFTLTIYEIENLYKNFVKNSRSFKDLRKTGVNNNKE